MNPVPSPRRAVRRIHRPLAALLLLLACLWPWAGVHADARKETLLVVVESGPNSLDIHGIGANRPSYGLSWNVYDRLLSYASKTAADGSQTYDYTQLTPELAEGWDIAPDGLSVSFRLRKDAQFHDGSPVTAADVKWSFDRAVTVGGFPTFQMKAGSLEKPEQFEVIDAHTFRVKFLRKDKLTLPDLGVPVAAIYNSKLALQHATDQDPWAMDWLKTHAAGGGAYRIASWKPGTETVYERYDNWKSGPSPKLKKVIVREVPSAAAQQALIQRGDVDIAFDLGPKTASDMAAIKTVAMVATPIENAMWYVGMNVLKPPFDNLKLRQAVAYALPYQKIMDAALYGHGKPLFGGGASQGWPRATAYQTDLAKARQLMAEAGFAEGFSTRLAFDQGLSFIGEPIALLVQESLAAIGIQTTIDKIPGANWRAALLKKDMPLMVNNFGGWLNYPEYFFFWAYHGQNAVFNTMSYANPRVDALIEQARFETNPARYQTAVDGFVDIAYTEVPRVPLFQPLLLLAKKPQVSGYRYWFHRQLDLRSLEKQ
ncbi:MAG: ABC transporter substrate-binding protein [Panacagrimonas sp.]